MEKILRKYGGDTKNKYLKPIRMYILTSDTMHECRRCCAYYMLRDAFREQPNGVSVTQVKEIIRRSNYMPKFDDAEWAEILSFKSSDNNIGWSSFDKCVTLSITTKYKYKGEDALAVYMTFNEPDINKGE